MKAGYAIDVNGKLFAESKGGYYKGKDGPRGGCIYDDFRPEFEKGKVTIAVKGFLRYTGYQNRAAQPSGHISVWLESMEIPQVVIDAVKAQGGK